MLEALRRLVESLSTDDEKRAALPKLGDLYSSLLRDSDENDSGIDLSETSSSSLSLLFALDKYQHTEPNKAKALVEATDRFKMSGAFGSYETSRILKFLFNLSFLNQSTGSSTMFSERSSIFTNITNRLSDPQNEHLSVFDEYSMFQQDVKSLIDSTSSALDLCSEQISKDMFDHSTYHLFSKRPRLSVGRSDDSGTDTQWQSTLLRRANPVILTTSANKFQSDGCYTSNPRSLNTVDERDLTKAFGNHIGKVILSNEEHQQEIKLYITGHSSHLSLDKNCLANGMSMAVFEKEREKMDEKRNLILTVKKLIDDYSKSDKILRQKLSWSLRNIVISLESSVFSLKSESINEINEISTRLFAKLRSIHGCALMLGGKSAASVACIISSARLAGVLQQISLMIKDLTVPVLDSVYSWLYLDQHCGLLTESISKDYTLQHNRDGSCWDKLFRVREDAQHNPLIREIIPLLLQVGKSCHIIRIMAPDHPLFLSDVPHIREMSKTAVEKWKKQYSSWIAESYMLIELRKEEHYDSIRKEHDRVQNQRKQRNQEVDLKAEKLRVERAIEIRNRQLSLRSMINQQISDKIRLKKLQQELDQIEEQVRKKYLQDKDKLIEEEKVRLIEEYKMKENEIKYQAPAGKIDEELERMKEELISAENFNNDESETPMEVENAVTDEVANEHKNTNVNRVSDPMEVEQPHVSKESATTETGQIYIPRKKVISGRGISESGFVHGTIITKKAWEEMEREQQAIKSRERVITHEEFMQKVCFEVESVIKSQRESSRREAEISSVTTYLEEEKALDTQEVIDFFNEIRAVLHDPIKIYASMIKDVLMFEILEKNDMIGYLQATSQLVWFQDGVFAMAFFDEVFPLVTTNFERGISMLNICLNTSKLSANMLESQKHHEKLYVDFSKNRSENKSPLSNLKGLSLYMDNVFPHNLIVDEVAQGTYREVNKFLFDIRFAHWNLDKIMFSQRGQSLTYDLRKLNLIRNEMTVFVGQYYNFLCTFIMQTQWKKFQKDVNKLKLKGELTIDSLKRAHDEYLRHIKTGCLLTTDMKRFLSHKNKMMSNIVMFCVCFTKYLVAEDDDLLNTAYAAGKSFRDSVRFFCDIMRSLETNLGIEGFASVYDYNMFYVDKNLRLPEIIEICSPHRRKTQSVSPL